ncbi:MAG: Rieske 2Fe-2S domain-containing protein [Thermoplasmata archaeon]
MNCSASCPFAPAQRPELSFPVGQIRRFETRPSDVDSDVDETKRNALKLGVIAALAAAGGGGLVGGSLQYLQPPLVGLSSFPKVQLVDLDGSPLTATSMMKEYDVTTSEVLTYDYPLTNEPNFLLNLAPPPGGTGGATNVPGGVGPLGSIVSYSAICQHLGCPAPAIHFYPAGMCSQTPGGKSFYIHCTCHGSTYDVTNGAANLTGPAVIPLPQVTLLWNDPSKGGDDVLYAVNVTGAPVKGHLSTLVGGYGVGSTSQLSKQTPVLLCNFPST